jgi:hypothetical protein
MIGSKDLGAGVVFVVIGALFAYGALGLELGTPFRMGPGFFPLILAGILILLGLLIAFQGLRRPSADPLNVPWQGLILILVAPIVFGVTVRGLGLLPAVGLVVLISAFASRKMSAWLALLLTIGLTLFCVLVFSYGLGLPIRLFGPWLRF